MTVHSDPNRAAALAALKRGDAPEAIRCLTEAIREAPEDAELVGFLGVAYGMEGDLDAAVYWLRKATQLGPGSASAYYNLGGALERAGQAEEAVRAYRRALVLEPQHPRARAALARLEAESLGPEAIPSPFPPEHRPGAPFPAPPPPAAEPAPAPDAGAAPEPGPWSCPCGAANAGGYLFCPRCGAPAVFDHGAGGEGPEDEGAAPAAQHPHLSTLPHTDSTSPGMSRKTRIALAVAAVPLLVTLGFGIGLWIRSRQSAPPPSRPVATQPAAGPSTDLSVAPPPRPPANAPVVETPAAEPGLGLTRDQVMTFLQGEIEWAFQESTDDDGRPRMIGRSADGLTDAELVGAPSDLEEAYLSFAVPPDEAWSPDLPNGRRVTALFDEYAPGASRWVMRNLEELIVTGADGEREEQFAGRTARIRWSAATMRARVGLSARPAGLVVVPAPARNWLEDPRQTPTGRRYRFLLREGGDAIEGTLLQIRNDIYAVRLDASGETVELHAEDGYEVEPVEPTAQERDWLQKAAAERRSRRQAALRRGDAQGRPLEVGRRYRFRVTAGEDVFGTLESLEEDLYHVRPDDGGELQVLRPESVRAVEAL